MIVTPKPPHSRHVETYELAGSVVLRRDGSYWMKATPWPGSQAISIRHAKNGELRTVNREPCDLRHARSSAGSCDAKPMTDD